MVLQSDPRNSEKNPPTYNAKVVKHSISSYSNEIITWELTMPKWLVAEFNTHKIEIERNSASSRAVPTKIILDTVKEFPVLPYEWCYNAKGMGSQERMAPEDEAYSNEVWLEARDAMIPFVERLNNLPSGRSADKQRVNRLLEPWMWTVVVCTMTGGGKIGINNFFGLRDRDGAQPEFRVIASMMHEQWHTSKPIERLWHLPYIYEQLIDMRALDGGKLSIFGKEYDTQDEACKAAAIISSARCGRVTHYRQGETNTPDEDIARGLSFAQNGHWSPLRHASKASESRWYGNMFGWIPISKIIGNGSDFVTKCCERSR